MIGAEEDDVHLAFSEAVSATKAFLSRNAALWNIDVPAECLILFIINDRNRNLPGITGILRLSPLLRDEDVMDSAICMPQSLHLKFGDVNPSSCDFLTEHAGIHPVLDIAL